MVRKKIVIITDRKRIAMIIKEDLLCVLGSNVNVQMLELSEALSMKQIDGDLFLFTAGSRVDYIRKKLSNPDNYIVITRTFNADKFIKIFEIPQRSRVLVVNDNDENTLQTMTLLYNLNVDNIIMTPYKNGEYDTAINIAITPGEADKVPKTISTIVDIGDRRIDMSTFMEIIYRLQINNKEISSNLLNYVSRLVNTEQGVIRNYKDVIIKNIQMEKILDMTEQAVAVTLKSGEIILCNKSFRRLSNVDIAEGVTSIFDVFDDDFINIFNEDIVKDRLIRIKKRDIVLTKSKIVYQEGTCQYVYFFNDITYVKELEQTVRKQLDATGFVAKYNINDFVYKSEKMRECLERAKIFANTEKTIIIFGQSGTGKELLAQSIHNMSDRRNQPFVAINCTALPASLLESELFGYESGAFTGARKEGKAGLFESSNNGTIFLDEIGDMPYELQSKLLRVVQEKQVMRIGSDNVLNVNIRIITATNKNLKEEVEKGNFREDLYYRINVLPIMIPPLCERAEDIMPLFKSFLPADIKIKKKDEQIIMNYGWPGNVRELRNAAEYYELMHNFDEALPHSILSSCEYKNFEKIEHTVFSEIEKAYEKGISIGREKLNEILKEEKKIVLSEYRLRKILNNLRDEGLIEIKKGRSGIIPKEC